MTSLNFCSYCQKITIHREEKHLWLGNLKKWAVYSNCTECNQDRAMWLENKENE